MVGYTDRRQSSGRRCMGEVIMKFVVVTIDWKTKKVFQDFFTEEMIAYEYFQDRNDGDPRYSVILVEER